MKISQFLIQSKTELKYVIKMTIFKCVKCTYTLLFIVLMINKLYLNLYSMLVTCINEKHDKLELKNTKVENIYTKCFLCFCTLGQDMINRGKFNLLINS